MHQEITILVGVHKGNTLILKDCLYYRFFAVREGKIDNLQINNNKQSTIDIYEKILADFFIDKKLVSVGYDIAKITYCSECYLGIKLENSLEEKLNIYFTSKALYAFSELENLVSIIKALDFYEYSSRLISKNVVYRMTIRPADNDRSSVIYIQDNFMSSYMKIHNQLGYYYRKSNNQIDELDLKIIFSLIRYFINCNIDNNPYYEYTANLLIIKANKNAFIEINDEDLIYELEKARILDDLWLVMHNLIDRMPLQEESLENKDELKRIRKNYNKLQNSSK